MFQIRHHEVLTDLARLSDLRAEFAERHCVLLGQVMDPALLARLLPLLAGAPAHERTHETPRGKVMAKELCVDLSSIVVRAFGLLFSNPIVFRTIEQVTGCPNIGYFKGRIYMMQSDSEQRSSWHSDNDGNRLIGLSLNLGQAYSGGAFQIRERRSERLLGEIFNTSAGDAHIFRIAPELQHRVTPITGDVTKTAFAGWFRAQPDSPAPHRVDDDGMGEARDGRLR